MARPYTRGWPWARAQGGGPRDVAGDGAFAVHDAASRGALRLDLSMEIVPVPCLRDNFAYLVCDGARAAVIDPGEAAPVLAALRARGLALEAVWATHHHPDHVGGVRALAAAYPGLAVAVHRLDAPRVAAALGDAAGAGAHLVVLEDGEVVTLGAVRAEILHNPGHTLGAISYLACAPGDKEPPALFTGDTLFGAGCGRLFEGDAAMMQASLSRLAALPAQVRVYFGHEYTRANLRFAEAVTPGDAAVAARRATLEAALLAGQPSTPSSIELERQTNPFLRCADPHVVAAVRARGAEPSSAAEVFAALRSWKDSF